MKGGFRWQYCKVDAASSPMPRVDHGELDRARSRQEHPLGRECIRRANAAVYGRQGRCVSRCSADPPGSACQNIGHVIASSISDRPWSQYYCCLLGTRTEFAQKYPVRDQAPAPSPSQGRRPLRLAAGAGGPTAGRSGILCTLRLCAKWVERNAIRRLAGLRS
jgi:hypothetical protein